MFHTIIELIDNDSGSGNESSSDADQGESKSKITKRKKVKHIHNSSKNIFLSTKTFKTTTKNQMNQIP